MTETLDKLTRAILEYDVEGATSFAAKAIEEGVDPLKTADVVIEAIKQVGDGYSRGELWLPDLVGAASAMKGAMSIINEEFKRTGTKRQSPGIIVIGTVFGDIHNIGKDMVATLAQAEGFEIIDLGINVKGEEFLEAVREYKPEILAMSSLLTTTAPEQEKVIKRLKDEGIRENVKVVIGGGAITANFAESIGADGYEPTAPMAVGLFNKLVGKGG